jgi:hypothetical protein
VSVVHLLKGAYAGAKLLGSMRSAGRGTQTEEIPNPVATPIGGNT